MEDREKVVKGLECCLTLDSPCGDCPYYSYEEIQELECERNLRHDALELLKEQEEREKAICKEICDFIRGACSTDTDDDKDFVCYEIQRCFTHFGRSVK